MECCILPGLLKGDITIIPSKSQAHRLLICAAFADGPTQLRCPETNKDIDATVNCLCALGAQILRTDDGYTVFPAERIPEKAELDCNESGSTLRFLLPVVGALGVDTTFLLSGRLPQRPLSPLWEEMERMGCALSRPTRDSVRCCGKLQPGDYSIAGNVSSQYITGLLFALSLIRGENTLTITGNLESKPYITLTLNALQRFGVDTNHLGNAQFRSPGMIAVEGDWSNGAFFLAAKHLGCELTIHGLDPYSCQGDRAIVTLLPLLQNTTPTIDVSDIPDLVPILSVVAAAQKGAVFTNIQRLRLKESDRVASTIAMLENLGGRASATETSLTVHGTGLTGGTVDAVNDHRIAMATAIAATICTKPVTIIDSQCVSKSYPRFWEEYVRLGGNYEQYLR